MFGVMAPSGLGVDGTKFCGHDAKLLHLHTRDDVTHQSTFDAVGQPVPGGVDAVGLDDHQGSLHVRQSNSVTQGAGMQRAISPRALRRPDTNCQ